MTETTEAGARTITDRYLAVWSEQASVRDNAFWSFLLEEPLARAGVPGAVAGLRRRAGRFT